MNSGLKHMVDSLAQSRSFDLLVSWLGLLVAEVPTGEPLTSMSFAQESPNAKPRVRNSHFEDSWLTFSPPSNT